jgi:NHLM bacteriocin system ABC transporter peptidase/ATP-binding protein
MYVADALRDWVARRVPDVRPSHIPRTPIVLQMENVECGAAALAMVLAHYGRWAPLEEIRVACGVTRDGSRASNIVRAAQGYGLVCRGFKKEPEQLVDMPMPCIVHWNFNHFVVLEGLDDRFAWLNDPAQGRRRVSREVFAQSFTGVVLAFEPSETFRPAGRPPAALPILLRLLAGSRAATWLLVAISACLVVPGLLVPAFTRVFVDDVLVRQAPGWLWPLLVGLGLTALARAAVTAFQQSLLLRLETKLSVLMTSRFLWRVLSLPIGFFQQRHAGDIATRVEANDAVTRLLSGALVTNGLNVAAVVFFAIAMAAYDLRLAAICVGISLLNVVAIVAIARRRDELNLALGVERGKVATATVGIVRTIETLKASGLEDDAFAGWAGRQALLLEAERKLGLYAVIGDVGPPLFAALTTAVILGLGGLSVMQGDLSLGSLVAFQTLMASFAAPIGALAQSAGEMLAVKSHLVRLEDVFAYPVETRSAQSGSARRLSGALEIDDLHFHYGPLDPPLIQDISLRLQPGMRIALVGGSGSGKSTLGRLIAGLMRPQRGVIRFDGVARDQLADEAFAASVAYVDQDVFLFEGSLRDNLSLWDVGVDEEKLVRALQDAAIYAEIRDRPGGLDCEVREAGANFSGGQRQRIELARALVGDPSLLILDEATAALDPATEQQIDDNLRRRGCACIIIAHRLSTIRDCDEIIVLDAGRIVERGPHDQLVARDGPYARMVASV